MKQNTDCTQKNVLFFLFIYCFVFVKAKESWEMNTSEKLEQSVIVKEKGTQYFKV